MWENNENIKRWTNGLSESTAKAKDKVLEMPCIVNLKCGVGCNVGLSG